MSLISSFPFFNSLILPIFKGCLISYGYFNMGNNPHAPLLCTAFRHQRAFLATLALHCQMLPHHLRA